MTAVKWRIPIGPFHADSVRQGICVLFWIPVLLVAFDSMRAEQVATRSPSPVGSLVTVVVNQYCVVCHDSDVKKGGLDLHSLSGEDVTQHPDDWERVVRKLRARQMPPMGRDRPGERTYNEVVSRLADSLDRAAAKNPNPGRTETFRRLNRAEYQNAIRDLLALEIDSAALLPKDDASHGFDNVTVGTLSPMLLDRAYKFLRHGVLD